MKTLPGIRLFNDLSAELQRAWRNKAIAAGILDKDYSPKQAEVIYSQLLLSRLGYPPDADPEAVNAYLKLRKLSELAEKNLLGQEVSSLFLLYTHNPALAAKLADLLVDSGYLTQDEINEKALSDISKDKNSKTKYSISKENIGLATMMSLTPLGPVNTALISAWASGMGDSKEEARAKIRPNEFNPYAFNNIYNEVKGERRRSKVLKEKFSKDKEDALLEARRRYLATANQNVYKDIQKLIDDYYEEETDKLAPQISGDLQNKDLTQVLKDFEKIAGGKDNNPGSNYWRAYHDTDAFKNFGDNERNEVYAKYLAYKQIFGEDSGKADEWLEKYMQKYVHDNMTTEQHAVNITSSLAKTAISLPASIVIGGAGILASAIGELPGMDYFAKIGSEMLTGRDLHGNELEGLNKFLNLRYLEDAKTYNTLDPREIEQAKKNGGVSSYLPYVIDPETGKTNFAEDVVDMLLMGAQMVGQMGTAAGVGALMRGGLRAAERGLIGLVTRGQVFREVGTELGIYTLPVATAYATGAYDETFNTVMDNYREDTMRDAEQYAYELIGTEGYQQGKEQYIKEHWKDLTPTSKTSLKDGALPLNIVAPGLERRMLEAQYHLRITNEIYELLLSEREASAKETAQQAGILTWKNVAALESIKYGLTTMKFGAWKMSGNSRKILEDKLKINTYGTVTQNAEGKFVNEGVKPLGFLGIKDLVIKSPKKIAAYRTARDVIMGGGFSNYTDDVVTAFGSGMGLAYGNSELLRKFDPEAYADAWYSTNNGTMFAHMVGLGAQGAFDMIKSGQPWHSFYIGVGGSMIGTGVRLLGRSEVKSYYDAENAKYRLETGKDISKWRKLGLTLNTYTQSVWSTYEQNRLGVHNLNAAIEDYNKTLDKQGELLNEIATTRQAVLNKELAEKDMSFSNYGQAMDALAMDIISTLKQLENNPLRGLDARRYDNELALLEDIANDNVSPEVKQKLILTAYGSRALDRVRPLTEQRANELWEGIKSNARKFNEFASNYYSAEAALMKEDASFLDPQNAPLLHQRAELMAKKLRIESDILFLQEDMKDKTGVSPNVDLTTRDKTEGQLNETAKTLYRKAAQETILELTEAKEKAVEELKEIESKLQDPFLSYEKREKLMIERAKKQATIIGADRVIPRLQLEVAILDNMDSADNTVTTADVGLASNAILLYNMVNHPEMYSKELLEEIKKYLDKVGEKGKVYIEELANLQNQYEEIEDAEESLKKSPETFKGLVHGLHIARANMVARAAYDTRVQTLFDVIKGLPTQDLGIHAAISLAGDGLFDKLLKLYPELEGSIRPYLELNKLYTHIHSLASEMVKDGTMTEELREELLKYVFGLSLLDADYLLDTGRQGVTDLIDFVKSSFPELSVPAEKLLLGFLRVAAVEKATTAYTEYKIKKLMLERVEVLKKMAEDLVKQLSDAAREEASQAKESEGEAPQESSETPLLPVETSQETPSENTELDSPELPSVEEDTTEDTLEAEPSEEELPKLEDTELPDVDEDEIPAGVKINEDGTVETMTAQEQVELLGLEATVPESLVDDTAPIVQETVLLQEEVHGCFFNPYNSIALNYGELIPEEGSPIYDWLKNEGINLGAIIDDELHKILKTSPIIRLMKIQKKGLDKNVGSNVFLVVEYTKDVEKHHLPENGGVINAMGKLYLIIGTMWNTKLLNNTPVARDMIDVKNRLVKNGVDYFLENPNERFYVDPVMHTVVTTFYSGHIVNTVEGETRSKTLSELIEQYNATHTLADLMGIENVGFGIITEKEGFYSVGPYSREKIHRPQLYQRVDKYGQVYMLVPAANGEIVPIYVNPITLSQVNNGELKTLIDTVLIPKLCSLNYEERLAAVIDLCKLLCISDTIKNPGRNKGILIGKENIPTITIKNGTADVAVFNLNNQNFSVEDVRKAIYKLDPRINLNILNLQNKNWVQRYDEAGALTTDSAKLGTYGGKYYVALINPVTLLPAEVTTTPPRVTQNSDYSRALAPVVTNLHVLGKRYVFRDNTWLHEDNTPITDSAERTLVVYEYKVRSGEALYVFTEGPSSYYVIDPMGASPIVIRFDLTTKQYYGVEQGKALEVIQGKRQLIERERADALALEALLLQELLQEQQLEAQLLDNQSLDKSTLLPSLTPTVPLAKNRFEGVDSSLKAKYTVEDILTREDMMDFADELYEIIEQKMQESDLWKNFDMNNIESELYRMGINTDNITNVREWLDNIKECG